METSRRTTKTKKKVREKKREAVVGDKEGKLKAIAKLANGKKKVIGFQRDSNDQGVLQPETTAEKWGCKGQPWRKKK